MHQRRCGWQGRVDETDNKYGKLTVMEYERNDSSGNAIWLCKCDCGGEKSVAGHHLRHRGVRSCGCLWEARPKPKGEAAFNSLYATWRANAKIRGYAWELTKDQVRDLTKQDCTYCGISPRHISHPKGCNGSYLYNGMDRANNNHGYAIDNVVPCCGRCNRAKGTMTTDEFKSFIADVYNHWVYRGQGNT